MIDTVAIRGKLIDAAISGRLTEQFINMENAEQLYLHIHDVKERLIRKGKIKKTTKVNSIENDELPFEIPKNWKWIRVVDIFCVINGDRGKNYPAKKTLLKEGEIPFISALNLDGEKVVKDENLLFLSETQYDKLSNGKMIPNDVIICIRGSLGKHGINQFEKGAIASSLIICRAYDETEILAKYLSCYLDSGLFMRELQRYNSGVAQPNLAANSFKKFIFPLPPREEMERIIEVIEKVKKQLDMIDVIQSSYTADVEVLKSKLIDAGIQGKLTEQLSEDGTAEELFAEIQTEKQQLIKEKKIKKEKALSDIAEEEIPFEIPSNWKWVRLADISNKIWAGGDKPDDFTKEVSEDKNIPVVANGVTDDGILGYTSVAKAPAETITVAGRGTIGFCTYRNYEYCPIVRLIVIEPSAGIDPKYLKIVMQALQESSVGSSIPQLTVPMIKPKMIPLPPYEEQIRIVQKLDELLELI